MKTARLDTRITEEQKRLYEQAVVLGHFTSLTEFLTAAADKEAEHIIQNYEKLHMDKEDRKLFVEMLLTPPKPNETLRKAAQDYKKSLS